MDPTPRAKTGQGAYLGCGVGADLGAARDVQRVIQLLVHLREDAWGQLPASCPGPPDPPPAPQEPSRPRKRSPKEIYNSRSSREPEAHWRPAGAAVRGMRGWGSSALTSRMAEQKRLCRTRWRACSFCGGSSPLRWSRSRSSTARDTSAGAGRGVRGRADGGSRGDPGRRGASRSARAGLRPSDRASRSSRGARRTLPRQPRPPRRVRPPAAPGPVPGSGDAGRGSAGQGPLAPLTPLQPQPQRLHQRSHVGAAAASRPPAPSPAGAGLREATPRGSGARARDRDRPARARARSSCGVRVFAPRPPSCPPHLFPFPTFIPQTLLLHPG